MTRTVAGLLLVETMFVAACGSDGGSGSTADSSGEDWTFYGHDYSNSEAPDKTGCGPSIVDGRVLRGYGFTLFGPPGDDGGVNFNAALTSTGNFGS